MKCFIALGSSLGDRRSYLERAAHALSELSAGSFRISPLYKTPALVPEGAPLDWLEPYLNAVTQIEWMGSAQELLTRLKAIEKEMGRADAARWAPRIIDLDLLIFGGESFQEERLQVPHPRMMERSFVLDPLRDLAPGLCIVGSATPVVIQARGLSSRMPWIMGILNLTPDSFSDGGMFNARAAFEARIKQMDELGIHCIDLGGESTRPGAAPVSLEEEWKRVGPALQFLRAYFQGRLIQPVISVDTRHAEIARRALEMGASLINDVSGLSDPKMPRVLREYFCDYVLMHSLTVPADPSVTLPEGCDLVSELKSWLEVKLKILEESGISRERVIFDPGIGFGKTAQQSLELLERMGEFSDLPVRILVGHSRKSFLKKLGGEGSADRDVATRSFSDELIRKGVDILRVHNFEEYL